jgi:hypothetical protein
MTDTNKLRVLWEIQRLIGHHPTIQGALKHEMLTLLEGFKEELEIQTFVVGEKVWFKLYDEWVRASVVKLGKVRVGIQITHFPEEVKFVSPKKLRKVEPK